MSRMRVNANTRGTPVWLQDFLSRDKMAIFPARLDAAQFVNEAGIKIQTSSDSAVGAVSIAINALTGPILPLGSTTQISGPLVPKGTNIDFTAAQQESIADPATAPTPTTATTGGTLQGDLYFIRYSYKNASGETLPSPAAELDVPDGTATNTLTVTAPALPTGATGINAYIGATAEDMLFAGTSATNVVVITAPPATTVRSLPTDNLTTWYVPNSLLARVTADVHVGATSISVQPLGVDIPSGSKTVFRRYQTLAVKDGTPVGRTYAERDARIDFGPAHPDDDEIYLLAFPIPDVNYQPDAELIRHQVYVTENFLPTYADMVSAVNVADPSTAPTLSTSGTTGQLPAGNYSVGYTFVTALGETGLSPVANVNIAVGASIGIASISLPTGALSINYYVSQSGGNTYALGYYGNGPGGAAYNVQTVGTLPLAPSFNTSGGTAGALLTKLRSLYYFIRGEA